MAKPTGKPTGRPKGSGSLFTEALAAEIIERISVGETLADICRSPHMPAVRTVDGWKREHEAFGASFARAREDGYDAIAARVRNTARGNGLLLGGDSTGDVQRDRLIIETDLKLLARWDPKRYGERSSVDVAATLTLEQLVLESMKPRGG